MVTTMYNTLEYLNIRLQILKTKTKLNFYQNICNFYDQMNYMRQSKSFKFEENPFSKGAQSIAFIMGKALF